MNILMLGGTGFIGSHVTNRLIQQDHKIRLLVRERVNHTQYPDNVEVIYGDFNDLHDLMSLLKGVDVVCHFISTTVPSTSNMDPVTDVRSNLVSTVKLLEGMRIAGTRRIIYLSSGGTVYGNSEYALIPETAPCHPICSYGVIKLAIENYLYMYQQLYGFKPLVLRVSNPYGPGQGAKGLQGIISTYLSKTIKQEKIEIWGDGETVRDYIYINDLSGLCVKTINSNKCGVYNAGSGIGTSINSVVRSIEDVTSQKYDVRYTPGRGFDVKRVVLDVTHTCNTFKWRPNTTLAEGIRKYYNWMIEET